MHSSRRLAIAVAIIMIEGTSAHAAANRTFVSALGNDANPCTVAQPCRTMQVSYNATVAGGEIEVLDPAGYGSLTISHAITIQGHGWASMNGPSNTNIITIAAQTNDKVTLRGLIVEGFGVAPNGIVFNSGGALVLEDSVIQNTPIFALLVHPTGSMTLSVSHTRFTGNVSVTTDLQSGLFVRGSFEHVIFDANISPLNNNVQFNGVASTVNFAMRDCTIRNSTSAGLFASGAIVNIMVQNSTIAANDTGVATDESATIRITKTSITGNQRSIVTGTQVAGTGVLSYGDNTIDGNSTNGPPTAKISQQ